jgi:hypothetical protein
MGLDGRMAGRIFEFVRISFQPADDDFGWIRITSSNQEWEGTGPQAAASIFHFALGNF